MGGTAIGGPVSREYEIHGRIGCRFSVCGSRLQWPNASVSSIHGGDRTRQRSIEIKRAAIFCWSPWWLCHPIRALVPQCVRGREHKYWAADVVANRLPARFAGDPLACISGTATRHPFNHQLIRKSILPATQLMPSAPWQVPLAALDSEAVREGVRAIKKRRPPHFNARQEAEKSLKLPGF